MGNVAVKVDCEYCDSTGFSNKWTQIQIPAYYQPGAVQRWNPVAGGVTFLGSCAVKVNELYRDTINGSDFIEMNGVQWNYLFTEDPGAALGQERLIIALTRKD
jgi:hypothetical protein